MRKIQVLVDSCADLSGELLEKYGIDYCRMNTVRDGQQTPASLLWEYYTPKELYDVIRSGERVTTTQVPPEEFINVFTKYLQADCDIIYIACSSKQSGSVNTAQVVAKKLLEDYPDGKIYCVDSWNASIGIGMLAIRAVELVREGMSAEEIVSTVEGLRNKVNQYVTPQTLEYMRRCGRVKASTAFFGNLMGVKPILVSDADGVQTAIKKAKGRMNSFKEIVSMLKETIENPEEQTIYVAHADCSEEEMNAVLSLIKEQIPCKDIVTVYIGPIIGASVGPDTVGVWGYGKEITYRAGDAK